MDDSRIASTVPPDGGPFGYIYEGDTDSLDHRYTVPAVLEVLAKSELGKRVFDAGCGNGVAANLISQKGYDVTGVDPAPTGIESANKQYPHLHLEIGSVYENLASRYGQFPYVISLEVIEHLFYPRQMAKALFDLTEPGGYTIISTPYHGYLKNLAIALAGKFDFHVKPLWDCGHIKFFSIKTLTELLRETGYVEVNFLRLGRIPCLAKSMLAVARKKASG